MIDEVVAPVFHNKVVPVTGVVANTELPQLFVTVIAGVAGIGLGAAVPLPAELVQELTVCVTVYVAFAVTLMDEVVAPVLQARLVPLVLNKELPQLLVTVTTGADGTVFGAAVPLPAALIQPFTVCVTV